MDTDRSMDYVVAVVAVVLIVLLVLFARGPEDQERSGASLPVATGLTSR
jgi:hypothetical protein